MKYYLRLLGYLKPHWPLIVFATFLSLIILALQGISVWVGAGFIEQVISGRTPDISTGDIGGLGRALDAVARTVLIRPTAFQSLVAGTIVLVGARLLLMLLREFKVFLIARSNQIILARIRSELFSHLTRLELSFTQKVRPGEVASIFARDIDQLNLALFDAVDRSFLQPARLLLSVGLMATLSFELTAWVVLFLIIGGAAVHYIGGHIERLQKNVMEDMASLQGHLTEYLSGAILSRIFNRESDERERFDATSRAIGKSLLKTIFAHNMAPQIIDAIFITGGGFLLILAGYRVLIQGTLSSGDVLKLALLLPMATYSMQALASMYASVRASIASAKRVFNLFDIAAMRPDLPEAIEPGPLKEGIEFRNVTYQVGERVILKDLNFFIPKGRKAVIYGPTGSGKTTVLGLIAGYLECSRGEIMIDGVDLKKLKLASWLDNLAMVTQSPLLLNGTIRENLLYAEPGADEQRLVEVLKLTLLWSDEQALPLGLDTPVGNRGELLSGGERQRLTIARALLTDPQLILMDEPTSMLDTDSKMRIRETIRSISHGRTLIMVTHDEDMRGIADIQFNLVDGRIEKQPALEGEP